MNSDSRTKSPCIILFGTFPDTFMEAIKSLDFDFVLSSKVKGDSPKADIMVIAPDMGKEATGLVKKHKVVPVVASGTNGFFDFNPLKEVGNSFLYTEADTWHMLQALIRAVETYKFVYDWKILLGEVSDFSKYFVKDEGLIKRS